MQEFKANLESEIEKLQDYIVAKEASVAVKKEAFEREQSQLEDLKKSLEDKTEQKKQLAEFEKWKAENTVKVTSKVDPRGAVVKTVDVAHAGESVVPKKETK